MQNASECQDAVTTRQDQGQTCRDVFANVKPSCVSRGSTYAASTSADAREGSAATRGPGQRVTGRGNGYRLTVALVNEFVEAADGKSLSRDRPRRPSRPAVHPRHGIPRVPLAGAELLSRMFAKRKNTPPPRSPVNMDE